MSRRPFTLSATTKVRADEVYRPLYTRTERCTCSMPVRVLVPIQSEAGTTRSWLIKVNRISSNTLVVICYACTSLDEVSTVGVGCLRGRPDADIAPRDGDRWAVCRSMNAKSTRLGYFILVGDTSMCGLCTTLCKYSWR